MGARVSRLNLRIGLGIVVGLLILAIGGAVVFLATFDPNSQKPRIIALVKQATGRDLALNGPIGLKLSLQPTLAVSDVAFANPPGFSRPEMATLQRLDLQLRLLPLLTRRFEISQLVLVHPDIRLETNAQGQTNWHFGAGQPRPGPVPANGPAPANAPAPANPGPAPSAASRPAEFSVQELRIEDGTIAYQDDATGKTTTLAVQRLAAEAAAPDAPLHLTADASYNGIGFNLDAKTGSLTRLQEQATTPPWPLTVSLQTGSAKLRAEGALTQPLQGRGYALTLAGSVPDMTVLAPLMPQIKLPPLHDLTFTAHLADQGAGLPEVSAVALHVGNTDLTAAYPGLTLIKLDVDAPAFDQPGKAALSARIGDLPIDLSAKFGAPGLLMERSKPAAAFPLDVTVQAADATLAVKGQIAQPAHLKGANLDLAIQVPDLGALSPLMRHPLPDVKAVSFQGTLTDADGGFDQGLLLHPFKLATADGDLEGEAAVRFGAKPGLTADLKSTRIDVDAIQASTAAKPAVSHPASPPPPPLPSPHARSGGLFPDQPIPWGLLQQADADLSLSIDGLHAGGTDYRHVNTHLVLRDGKLRLDPFTADLPAGHLEAKAAADTTTKPTPVTLTLHEPGLPLRPLLAALGEPPTASGNLEVYVDLHGMGDTPHAIAASLDGFLGVAVANGTIDNRLLGATLSRVLEPLNALDLVGRGGTSDIRCLASRLEFKHGIGTFRSLALSSSLLTMTGGGSVNLGADTLDLELRPQARIGGTNVVVPMRVTGPINAPATKVDRIGAAEDNAGTVAGAIVGNATPLGVLGGLLGADKLVGGGSGDICPGSLALARGSAAPAEAAVQPATQPSKPKPAGAAGLLQQLFR